MNNFVKIVLLSFLNLSASQAAEKDMLDDDDLIKFLEQEFSEPPGPFQFSSSLFSDVSGRVIVQLETQEERVERFDHSRTPPSSPIGFLDSLFDYNPQGFKEPSPQPAVFPQPFDFSSKTIEPPPSAPTNKHQKVKNPKKRIEKAPKSKDSNEPWRSMASHFIVNQKVKTPKKHMEKARKIQDLKKTSALIYTSVNKYIPFSATNYSNVGGLNSYMGVLNFVNSSAQKTPDYEVCHWSPIISTKAGSNTKTRFGPKSEAKIYFQLDIEENQ